MKICIIGGGLTGLVAARALAGVHDVDIFEKKDHLGGCLSSYQIDHYWIERYYHHCFSGDSYFLALLSELELDGRLEWLTATSGYYANHTVYPLSTPLQILRYPHLSPADKAKLAWLTFRSKNMDAGSLDTVPARQFIIESLGEGIYNSFFEPLLRSKFGENRTNVSAAWLLSRIAIRSNRGLSGERLGYLNGGFHQLIDALECSIRNKGGRVFIQCPATNIRRRNGAWEVNDTPYDTILSTIPPQELEKVGGPESLPIPYQGAACVTLGLENEMTGGVYWLNMKDDAPYGAIISHTNFVPHERYGEHIVYLASYFSGNLPENFDRHMVNDFCTRFSIKKDEIHWQKTAVEPWAGPVYTLGYRSLIPAYEQKGLFMAGMFSLPNYPERSMDGAVRAGCGVADRIEMVTACG